MSSELEAVPDSLLLAIVSCFDENDLIAFELVSKRIRNLNLTSSWEGLCHKRWQDWPRYRWRNLRDPYLIDKTWKQRFFWVEKDYARTILPRDELESIQWYFNFTPEAGGRGSQTLRRCVFRGGMMYVPSFPPLICRLVYHADVRQQKLYVENFPPHTIERLACNGEWIIKNENVTCVSCHETEKLAYNDRGFQD